MRPSFIIYNKRIIERRIIADEFIDINVAVITAAVITTHHESDLRLRLKIRYLVICAVVTAAVITAAFLIDNITPFKNSLPFQQQYKQIHFVWRKYHCFSVFIYKYIYTYLSYLVTHFINNTSKIGNFDYS